MSDQSENKNNPENKNLDKVIKNSIGNFFNDETSHTESGIDIELSTDKNKEEGNIDYIEIASNIYKQVLNREPDLGGLKFYSNQLKYKIITEEKLRNTLKESKEYKKMHGISDTSPEKTNISSQVLELPESLVYCMMGTNRLDEIKPYIETVLPYVDTFIFIDGGSTDGTVDYLNELSEKTNKMELYTYEWKDRFSEQRNNYLSQLRERNYNGWVLTSDTDEHFPEETLSNLRTLIKESNNGTEYTGIKFKVQDVSVDDDDRNKILSSKINEYWKPLMFKFSPEIHYEGEPHESLVGSNLKWKTTELIYQHIRSSLHILSRAAENFFISNSNRYSDKWAHFIWLCTHNDIKTFKDYWTLFEKHELPKEVEDWIREHKDDKENEGDSEVRETYILYEEVLPKRRQKKSTFKERFEQALDSKLTNEITEKIKDSVLLDEMSKSKPDKKIAELGNTFIGMEFPGTSGTFTGTFPDIKYQTNILTFPKQSEYELINQYCEQCSSPNEALIEMIIHHKHGITMCKKCWLNLADYIKKKIGET